MRATTISMALLLAGQWAGLARGDALKVQAVYSLPLKPEYADAATYELKNARWDDRGGMIWFTYDVPADLMGRDDEEMVMFTPGPIEPGKFFHMVCHRTSSEAYCTKENNVVACAIHFRNLAIDRQQVSERLLRTYGPGPLTDQRQKAAVAFSSDAVGSVSVYFSAE